MSGLSWSFASVHWHPTHKSYGRPVPGAFDRRPKMALSLVQKFRQQSRRCRPTPAALPCRPTRLRVGLSNRCWSDQGSLSVRWLQPMRLFGMAHPKQTRMYGLPGSQRIGFQWVGVDPEASNKARSCSFGRRRPITQSLCQ
jgi:hypothetical protein